jgi:hypothetical protein
MIVLPWVRQCTTKWFVYKSIQTLDLNGRIDTVNLIGSHSIWLTNNHFQLKREVIQPQLGTWSGATLSYNQSDSSNLNYIVDSKQSIQINTDWVDESYNDIFKQLLVSEEIYWVKSATDLLPLTISTNSLTFKTGAVDKLIQYTFELDFGQGYKLIL